jgi:hypothetical protein
MLVVKLENWQNVFSLLAQFADSSPKKGLMNLARPQHRGNCENSSESR